MRALWVVIALAGCAPTAAPPATSATASSGAPRAPSLLSRLEGSVDLDGRIVGSSAAPATIAIVFASWCPHCRDELHELDAVRATHPGVRMLGVNYRGHEEYDGRGSSDAVRAFAREVPWLRVVPIGEDVFDALGRPPKIPVVIVFDHTGAVVETFDRRTGRPPPATALDALLTRLGA